MAIRGLLIFAPTLILVCLRHCIAVVVVVLPKTPTKTPQLRTGTSITPPLVLVFPILASVHMQQTRSPGRHNSNWLSKTFVLTYVNSKPTQPSLKPANDAQLQPLNPQKNNLKLNRQLCNPPENLAKTPSKLPIQISRFNTHKARIQRII